MIFAELTEAEPVLSVKTPGGTISLVLLKDGTVVVRALYRGDGAGRIPSSSSWRRTSPPA